MITNDIRKGCRNREGIYKDLHNITRGGQIVFSCNIFMILKCYHFFGIYPSLTALQPSSPLLTSAG